MMCYPLLYELNTRCWLRELTERTGRRVMLADVPETEFAQWQRLGFTHIWLMGVWSSGPCARACALAEPRQRQVYSEALPDWQPADVTGSPYAIAEYRIPAELGGEAGLQTFRGKLHDHGLRLVLDFVPNHLGLDHPWVRQRPELFVQRPGQAPEVFRQDTASGPRWLAHGKDPNFAAWSDTVQLDYRRPATRAAMTELLESIAARGDGVRCDMAMLLLNDVFANTWRRFPCSDPQPAEEFWPGAIAAARNVQADFLFLAEVYWGMEPRLQALGFDYTYDKTLYDALMAHDGAGVQRHLFELPPEGLARGAHFLENHNEPRIASRLSPAEQRAAALLVLGLPGLRFLHEGQLAGARVKTPVQLARRCQEPVQANIVRLYEQLLTTLPASAVGQGKATLLRPRAAAAENPTAQTIIAIEWQAEPPNFDLVVVNLAPHRSRCCIPLTMAELPGHNWSMRDLLGQENRVCSGDDLQRRGLRLDLPAHAAQLFHFEPARCRELGLARICFSLF